MFLGCTTIQQSIQRPKQTGVNVPERQRVWQNVEDYRILTGKKSIGDLMWKNLALVNVFLQSGWIHSHQGEKGEKKQRHSQKLNEILKGDKVVWSISRSYIWECITVFLRAACWVRSVSLSLIYNNCWKQTFTHRFVISICSLNTLRIIYQKQQLKNVLRNVTLQERLLISFLMEAYTMTGWCFLSSSYYCPDLATSFECTVKLQETYSKWRCITWCKCQHLAQTAQTHVPRLKTLNMHSDPSCSGPCYLSDQVDSV